AVGPSRPARNVDRRHSRPKRRRHPSKGVRELSAMRPPPVGPLLSAMDARGVRRGSVFSLTLDPSELELVTVVNRAVDASRAVIDARRLQLTVSLTPAVRLMADGPRLEQVLTTLLCHAGAAATRGAQVSLTWRLQRDEVLIRLGCERPMPSLPMAGLTT